jgi:hypothetical protein
LDGVETRCGDAIEVVLDVLEPPLVAVQHHTVFNLFGKVGTGSGCQRKDNCSQDKQELVLQHDLLL